MTAPHNPPSVMAGLAPAIYVFGRPRAKDVDARGSGPHISAGTEPMPTIAYFYGIAIRLYFVDHPPPQFFASYSGHDANVEIETGEKLSKVIFQRTPRAL